MELSQTPYPFEPRSSNGWPNLLVCVLRDIPVPQCGTKCHIYYLVMLTSVLVYGNEIYLSINLNHLYL